MLRTERIRLSKPAFCGEPECSGLIRRGPAAQLPDGTLFHEGCLTYFRRCGGALPAAEQIHHIQVAYSCRMPKDPELYRIEHLPQTVPFELIATKIPHPDAHAMYLALADIYVRVAIRRSRAIRDSVTLNDILDRDALIILAERFTPLDRCVVLDEPIVCALASCEGKIYEGAAVQTADGAIYHPLCPRVLHFESGGDVGPTTEIVVRYSCAPPRDSFVEELLKDNSIATLERAFRLLETSAGSSLEDVHMAYLAVVNLVDTCGICGRDLERLAEKY